MLIYLPSIRKNGGINNGALTKRTINFGINPNKGGRPPSDRRVSAITILV